MAATEAKLTAAVQEYLDDLRRVRASGGATGERSYYPPLANLLNAVGGTRSSPRVFCVGELAQQGAGHPDFGLYAARQVQRGNPREGQIPECGVLEVKPAGDDAWLTAEGDQVSRYWNQLQARARDQHPRLRAARRGRGGQSRQAGDIPAGGVRAGLRVRAWRHPSAFARESGRRPGGVPVPGVVPSRRAGRAQETWRGCWHPTRGTGWRGSRRRATRRRSERCGWPWRRRWGCASRASVARPSSAPRWCRPSSTASSPPGCSGRGRRRHPPAPSTGAQPSGTSARLCCGRSSSSCPIPAGWSHWDWSRCWTGRRRRWTA